MQADIPTFVVKKDWWFLLHEKGGFYYLLKGPKHDQVGYEFFYIKQTRMVR